MSQKSNLIEAIKYLFSKRPDTGEYYDNVKGYAFSDAFRQRYKEHFLRNHVNIVYDPFQDKLKISSHCSKYSDGSEPLHYQCTEISFEELVNEKFYAYMINRIINSVYISNLVNINRRSDLIRNQIKDTVITEELTKLGITITDNED